MHPKMWITFCISIILGDRGAVSGGGKKSKRARKKFRRRKVKNAKPLGTRFCHLSCVLRIFYGVIQRALVHAHIKNMADLP